MPLQFGPDCTTSNCFGYGSNAGAGIGYTNMTCDSSSSLQAWQDSDQLLFSYGRRNVFESREELQYKSNVCNRIECRLNGKAGFTGKYWWSYAEFVINVFFTTELVMRLTSSTSMWHYFQDKLNLLDIINVVS